MRVMNFWGLRVDMLKMIQRGLLTVILYTFTILTLCACGNSEVEKFAEETAAVFASGDIAEINSLIFGDVYLPVDSRLEGIVEDEPIQNGLLTELFSHSTVDVNKVKKDTIQFVVSAPDMTAVFRSHFRQKMEKLLSNTATKLL